jgi:hypothetical protein
MDHHSHVPWQLKIAAKVVLSGLPISGREGGVREMRINVLEAILRAQAPADLTWTCRAYANETHLSTWIKGFWDGVKYCYGKLSTPELTKPSS